MSPRPLLLLLLNVTIFAQWAKSADILFVTPMPSHSHQIVFRPIWEALAHRGHHMTVVTPNPVRDPKLVNVTEIDVADIYEIVKELYEHLNGPNVYNLGPIFQDMLIRMWERILEHPQMQDLIVNKSRHHFDVVIVEALFNELLVLGHHFDAPTILLSSFDVQSILYEYTGNPRHPIANPDFMLPFAGELTFKERVGALLSHLFMEYFRKVKYFPVKRREIARFFGEDVPDIPTLLSRVELMLVNVNPVLDGARPLGPNTIAFGGGVHIQPPKELPKDLKEFLDAADEGFVYFSLGSNIRWNTEGFQLKFKAFLEVFDKLPYKVLAKYNGEEMEWMPKNVKIVNWVSQQDVLRHPNLKCFITQGGRQSLEEAIYINVPLVVLPMFGDQLQNGLKIQLHKIGKSVRHMPTLDKKELLEAVLEVTRDPTYKQNIIRLSQLALDQPMTGIEKVTWWTEHVIRNGNARHLRNRSVELPWYQFFLIDVIAFLLTVLTVTVTVVTVIIRSIFRMLRTKKDGNDKGKKKKE